MGRTARPDPPRRAVSLGRCAVLLCSWLVAPAWLPAQETSLQGRLVNVESGDPIVSGTVRVVWGGGPGQGPEARTDDTGGFLLRLAPGRYVLLAQGEGYETRRLDGIRAPRSDTSWVIALTPLVARSDPLITSPDGGRLERVSAGATSASVVGAGAAREGGAFTHADLLEGLPGVTTAWTGIQGRTTATRGFGAFFAGSPLLLEDDRIAQMPSSRMNAFELIPSTLLDVERLELLRGPMSALYGPNAAGGAIRIVTSSPIDRPGTTASLTAGQREVVHGAVREAVRLGQRSGLAVSGQYFRGLEWEAHDTVEAAAGPPSYAESGGGRIRLDFRPWSEGEIVLDAGLSRIFGSMLLLREGPAQVTDWTQSYGHARVRKGRLSAQGFATRGDAGSSVSLATGSPIVDRSSVLGGGVQYARLVRDWLDVTGGLDGTRTTPVTDGTIHGAWENADGVTEVGAYAYGVATPSERTRVDGALRLDWHNRLDGARLSPRLAVTFDATPRQTVRAAFNRGYTSPTPDLLFADQLTGSVPLLDSLAFDVRVVGLPDQALTFNRRCVGGVEDRCMFSPFLPGIRMPATGAALWDAVLVPLALEDEQLRSTLASIGISPNAFAQIVGRPGPDELASRLVTWAGGNPNTPLEPTPPPSTVEKLRPTITESLEVGLRGTSGGRLSYSVDVHAARVSDLVGPLEMVTPTLYLDGASVDSFLMRRMIGVGMPPALAEGIARGMAEAAAGVPLGTLAPDEREDADLVLAYRNLGAVTFWGADVGARWDVTPQVSLLGSFSYLSEDCFDQDADGVCGTAGDVTLNAPNIGASATVRWSHPVLGITVDGRVRHAGSFPVNAGPYAGTVEARTLVDVGGRFAVRWAPGATISFAVTNLLDAAHRDFIGTPAIGRLAVATLQYAF